ncbi:hypothetical protein VNO78_10298 [Psophocarpus tetragonolobus]|uniref:Uncharacterized protein n=1 Tax=Psophocarpus tetragonolobus TaxID=3891 RepID=A0AAN9SL22_PSOTE
MFYFIFSCNFSLHNREPNNFSMQLLWELAITIVLRQNLNGCKKRPSKAFEEFEMVISGAGKVEQMLATAEEERALVEEGLKFKVPNRRSRREWDLSFDRKTNIEIPEVVSIIAEVVPTTPESQTRVSKDVIVSDKVMAPKMRYSAGGSSSKCKVDSFDDESLP